MDKQLSDLRTMQSSLDTLENLMQQLLNERDLLKEEVRYLKTILEQSTND